MGGLIGNKSRTGMTNSPEMRANISKALMGSKCGLGNKSRTGQKRSPEEVAKQVAAYKAGGYKPTEEHKKKCSEALKGRKKPDGFGKAVAEANKNRVITQETRDKLSKASKGCKRSEEFCKNLSIRNKGKKLSKEHVKKLSNYWKEHRDECVERGKKSWQDPEKVKIMVSKMRLAKQQRPNNLEASVMEMLHKHFPDEWEYSGNGGLVLGRCCPDFVRNHGHNQVIEIYGDYWHRGENPQDRVDLFDTYGYKTLVIWENEVHSMSEEEFVKLVFKFMQKVDLFYYTPNRVAPLTSSVE
jgi:hypothetical protein